MEIHKTNIHGIVSFVLFSIAFGIGIVWATISSIIIGFVDLLLVIMAFINVSVIYCSKCKCRISCHHVVIGKISILFSKSNPDAYNSYDIIVGLFPMIVAIAFPQFWLIKNTILLICFWTSLLVGGLEAIFFICPKCLNYKCKMCRNKIIVLGKRD